MEGKVAVGRFILLKRDVASYNIAIAYLRQQLSVHLRNANREAQHEVEHNLFTLLCARTGIQRDIAQLEERHQRRRS